MSLVKPSSSRALPLSITTNIPLNARAQPFTVSLNTPRLCITASSPAEGSTPLSCRPSTAALDHSERGGAEDSDEAVAKENNTLTTDSGRPRLAASLLLRRVKSVACEAGATVESAAGASSPLRSPGEESKLKHELESETSTVEPENENHDEERQTSKRLPNFAAINALLKRRGNLVDQDLSAPASEQLTSDPYPDTQYATYVPSGLSTSRPPSESSPPSDQFLDLPAFVSSGRSPAQSTPTPSLAPTSAKLRPLSSSWTFYLQNSRTVAESNIPLTPGVESFEAFEAGLQVIGVVTTVAKFLLYMAAIPKPSSLSVTSRIYFFRNIIRPAWEDQNNVNGGQWMITIKDDSELLDRSWMGLIFALVGGELGDDGHICGAVLLKRPRNSRIQLWVRDSTCVPINDALAHRLVELLQLHVDGDAVKLDFRAHRESIAATTSYRPNSHPVLPRMSRKDRKRGKSPALSPQLWEINQGIVGGAMGGFVTNRSVSM